MSFDRKSAEVKLAIRTSLFFSGFLLVAIEILSFWFIGSLNPIRIYSLGTTTQIVFISILLAFLASYLLACINLAIVGPMSSDPRFSIGFGVVSLIAITLITSYCFTRSLNPVDVFREGKVLGIVIIAILFVMLAGTILRFIYIAILVWRIQSDTGRSFRDVYCKFCDGRADASTWKCPHCKEWVHLTCWRKAGGSIMYRCTAPECQLSNKSSSLDDLFRKF